MIRLVVLCLVVTSVLHVCKGGEYGNSGNNNYKPPITYAGPIVYSDEKPPIISFPGPPAHGGGGGASNYNKGSSYGGGGSYGYAGDSKGPNSITYVPLPLDDLPILIYQSKDKPPIHVMNRPTKDSYASQSQQSAYATNYGPPASGYGSYGGQSSTSSYGNYGGPSSYAPPSSSYAAPPSPKPVYVPKPSTPSAVYLPSVKPQYSGGSSYGPGSYGSSSNSYGMSYGGGGSYSSGGTYGGGSMSYNNVGNAYGSSGGPSSTYNPPAAPPPPPHIVYSGHPPIHVYQQPNVYNQPSYASNVQSSYGGGGAGYGSSGAYGGGGGAGYGTSSGAYGGGGSYGYKPSGYAQQQPSGYGGKPQSQNYGSKPSYGPPKQTYVPAPVGYHKPPIIIYQGVRPPVHVYSEPSPASNYGASYESGAAPGYGGYSTKNGNEWEPLKTQEGAAAQGNAAKTFSEKMDQEVAEEEQQQLETETENDFNTAEPEQEQVSQQVK